MVVVIHTDAHAAVEWPCGDYSKVPDPMNRLLKQSTGLHTVWAAACVTEVEP